MDRDEIDDGFGQGWMLTCIGSVFCMVVRMRTWESTYRDMLRKRT